MFMAEQFFDGRLPYLSPRAGRIALAIRVRGRRRTTEFAGICGKSPSPQRSQSELRSSRPRKSGERES